MTLERCQPPATWERAALGRPGRAKLGWVLIAALLAAAGAGTLYYRSHRSKALTERDTIVLADFANSTSDPVFDDTLKQTLSVALRQSPFLNVVSGGKVAATLKLMTRPRTRRSLPKLPARSASAPAAKPTSRGKSPLSAIAM